MRAQLSALGMVVLGVGLTVAVIGSQQQQDQRSKASTDYQTIQLKSYTTKTISSSTYFTINKPSGVSESDVMVAQVVGDDSDINVTAPTGWKLIRTDRTGSATMVSIFYKVAGSSEPSSYTFRLSLSDNAAGGIAAYTGVDTTSPIDAHSGKYNQSTSTMTGSSVTTTTPADMLIFFGAVSDSSSVTPPSGMTEKWDLTSGLTAEMAQQLLTTSGATGTRTGKTTAYGESNIVQMVALKPAGGATSEPETTTYPSPTAGTSGPSISASPSYVAPGGTVTVTWSGVQNPQRTMWFVFQAPGVSAYNSSYWAYTSSCTKTPGSSGKSSGTCTFKMPSSTNTYTLTLYKTDYNYDKTIIATGNSVKVTNYPPTPTYAPTTVPTYVPTTVPTDYPTPTNEPTEYPSPTTIPTVYVSPTYTPTNAPEPTYVPQPTATPVPGGTVFNITLLLHGVGKGGDSANPLGTGNMTPVHPQRTVALEVYDSQNQLALAQDGTVTFDTASGFFKGSVDMGTTLASGVYTIKVKSEQFLKGLFPGIQNITAGTSNTLAQLALINGDINGDNIVNILDYNVLIGCYSDLSPAVNCPAGNEVAADLDDDGHVNQFDYNLFLREMNNRGGQ